MLKFSTHTPLFLDKVIINFNENDIRSILIHLVNELNKSNFNQNVNNIYFNCECLFELLHRISLIKHFNLINDFKRFFVEFYNIKNEIKCCIFDIDLDSIKYMKSDSLVIKKALFLIYYVMKKLLKNVKQDEKPAVTLTSTEKKLSLYRGVFWKTDYYSVITRINP